MKHISLYVRVLYDMYSHPTLTVKWIGKYSSSFDLQTGVKHGGVLDKRGLDAMLVIHVPVYLAMLTI